MFTKSYRPAILAAAALALAPAAASASTFDDGRVSPREARQETRSLLRDAEVRGSLIRVPTVQTDGTPTTMADPLVVQTKFTLGACHRESARVVVCGAGVSGFYVKGAKSADRYSMFEVRVVASKRHGDGSATVINLVGDAA